ncbi:hypothetical protein [Thermocoleostomius sinensis]|uniref:Uncharacterized protein n=1 Tax=Thermocoleostomius sinensis A174 TaxID=2016057 RepID=A0A9E8ZAV6_9CYAN|nr:hypothetical protein [Thermocoleostomius sinensis]WAL59466.1 hypothetical protein OXH18_20175 [Thermocoleostomius sinensis A174]
MKFKANSDPSTRNVSAPNLSASNLGASSQPSAPSVPISVYRELAAELQATRGMVDSLNAKNQELTAQNHRLRQEIHRFAQTAIALQTIVEPPQTPVYAASNPSTPTNKSGVNQSSQLYPRANAQPTLEEAAAAAHMAAQLRATTPDATFTALRAEEAVAPSATSLPPERRSRDLGGLWLMLTIVLIMVTAFGAGFLVVRPLLPTSK